MKYRSKPIVIEAIEYRREHNIHEVMNFFGNENGKTFVYDPNDNEYYIETLEGRMKCSKGDWIIRGTRGEYYPCKSDVFQTKYEQVIHAS